MTTKTTMLGLLCLLALSACAPMARHSPIPAIGPAMIDRPSIRAVRTETVAADKLMEGDIIVALDGEPVATLDALLSRMTKIRPTTFTVERNGSRFTFPIAVWFGRENEGANAFLLRDIDAYTFDEEIVAGGRARGALVWSGRMASRVFLTRWESAPRLLEVEVQLKVPPDCTDCTLRDIGILDLSRRSILSALALEKAAFVAVPDLGVPAQPVAVPPPTVVGSVASTVMSGNVRSTTYGNSSYGTIHGQASTMTTPIYDYTAQNAALGHNLGVAIRNSQIQSANAARSKFQTARLGNLRAGKLNAGEYITGHVFFVAPAGFDGPYAVVVASGEKDFGYALFAPEQGNR